MAAVQPGAEDPAALKAIARHAEAIATVRMFLSRSEALRVVLLLDLGDGDPPAMRFRRGQRVSASRIAGRNSNRIRRCSCV